MLPGSSAFRRQTRQEHGTQLQHLPTGLAVVKTERQKQNNNNEDSPLKFSAEAVDQALTVWHRTVLLK